MRRVLCPKQPRRFLQMRSMAEFIARRLMGAPANIAASIEDDGRVWICVFDVLGNGIVTGTALPLRPRYRTGRELRGIAVGAFALVQTLWTALDAESQTVH